MNCKSMLGHCWLQSLQLYYYPVQKEKDYFALKQSLTFANKGITLPGIGRQSKSSTAALYRQE